MPAAIRIAKNRPLARGDACQGCKTRKVRCTAERPACSNCVKRKRECVYHSSPPDEVDSTTHLPSAAYASSSQLSPSSALPTSVPRHDSTSSSSSRQSLALLEPGPSLDFAADGGINWMADLGMIGLFPWPSGGQQSLPAPWSQPDMSALLSKGGISPDTMIKEDIDLTEAERDHLLLLYFTNSRIFGFDMHIATFYDRLRSSDPALRPHPCLLNAMYLMTCRASPVESLRQKEHIFLKRAKEEMELAIGPDNRLFDATRAGTMITCYLYASQRLAEGWAMLGQTAHLAIACGLDRIECSTGIEYEPSEREKRRGFGPYIAHAATQIDLAERIHAFWALFIVDRCAAIAFEWPAGIDQDRVTTPLPRPWAEYETNDPHLVTCDTRLPDLFLPLDRVAPNTCGIDHMTDLGHVIQSIALMYRACIRPSRTEQEDLLQCLVRYKNGLPDALTHPQKSSSGEMKVTGATASLQFVTLCTEMFLYSADAIKTPDPRALDAARRVLGVLHLLEDVNVGDVNLFMIVLWCRVGRLLIWESRRLESIGEAFAAASYAKDVSFLTGFLQQHSLYPLAAKALVELKDWWKDDLGEFQRQNENRRRASRYT